jgi:hypothetical protein
MTEKCLIIEMLRKHFLWRVSILRVIDLAMKVNCQNVIAQLYKIVLGFKVFETRGTILILLLIKLFMKARSFGNGEPTLLTHCLYKMSPLNQKKDHKLFSATYTVFYVTKILAIKK